MRLLIITTITLLFSCKVSENTNKVKTEPVDNEIAFNLVYEGTNSGFLEKKEQIITNQTDFEKSWNIALVNYLERNPVPTIDFEKNQVILITMGEQTSGGYTLKTDSVTNIKTGIAINATAKKPGASCMTTSVMTYPYQMISIPKTNQKIEFKITEDIYDCGK